MNDRKLNNLFETVRRESAPCPAADFGATVMRQVQLERAPGPVSFVDQLNALFPRLALAASAVILFCLAGDLILAAAHSQGITESARQIANEWLLPESGI